MASGNVIPRPSASFRTTSTGIFPGGFGTLDELFELLTLTQTGKSSPMPILLYDRAFWTEVLNFEALARRGLIKRQDLDLFDYVDTPEQAMAHLQRGLTV